jgi:hypothetical protein
MRSRGSTSTRAMANVSGGFLSGVGSAIGSAISAFGNGVSSFISVTSSRKKN